MDYELAKQLKEAGFPIHVYQPAGDYDLCWVCGEEQNKCIPKLSELIEACGERFDCLRRLKDKWVCGYISMFEVWETESEGTTPEEAVALLYIALNKNGTTK